MWTRMVLLSSEKGVALNWLRATNMPLPPLLAPLIATNWFSDAVNVDNAWVDWEKHEEKKTCGDPEETLDRVKFCNSVIEKATRTSVYAK